MSIDDNSDLETMNGHTLDDLAEYLERGETPPDPTIDGSAECQIALDDLRRLKAISDEMLDDEIDREPLKDEGWFQQILGIITNDVQAGRDIPVQHAAPTANLSLTEAAVRGVVRRAGDELGGILIGKVRFDGDVTVHGEPIRVEVTASVFWGERIPELTALVRTAIQQALALHTDLTISAVDVRVTDVHPPKGA